MSRETSFCSMFEANSSFRAISGCSSYSLALSLPVKTFVVRSSGAAASLPTAMALAKCDVSPAVASFVLRPSSTGGDRRDVSLPLTGAHLLFLSPNILRQQMADLFSYYQIIFVAGGLALHQRLTVIPGFQ